ncbi:lytic transglycosylase domain-containing protein [Nitrospirales bacterium NOB]|nr:lytic transglycosylase domain-containing protein [Nitrospira sp. NTP2]MDL1888633.1 lytic transglycosylase domain-containing protein [Nitrospirales bacterium NOB]RIK61279.1 MAG: hypothetical protein DCC63_00635 [Nitrospira sp.]
MWATVSRAGSTGRAEPSSSKRSTSRNGNSNRSSLSPPLMAHPDWNVRWTPLARALCPILVVGSLLLVMSPEQGWTPGLSHDEDEAPDRQPSIAALIALHATHYALDPALLKAIIQVESNFNPQAVSPKGAIGLMQLMPLTASALDVLDPFDPNDNIRAGAALLRRLLDRFGGDLSLALAAYHVGEARVSRAVGLSSLSSTRLYVERVLTHYHRFVADAR